MEYKELEKANSEIKKQDIKTTQKTALENGEKSYKIYKKCNRLFYKKTNHNPCNRVPFDGRNADKIEGTFYNCSVKQ